MTQNWSEITLEALGNMWQGLLDFVPTLLIALIVFIIGWLISCAVGRVISQILAKLNFNRIFEKRGWKDALEKAEIKVNPSDFIGAICKWILVIVFLLATVEILGFVQFTEFLERIIAWLPNLIVASAIFVVAVIVADILEKVIKATVRRIDVEYTDLLGTIVRWAIYVFAGLAILTQLGITPVIIHTVIMGFVGMVALALGLSFGRGGKDAAARLIEDLKQKLSRR